MRVCQPKEKRVEEHVGEGERKSACMWERKREKEHKHMGEKEREKALWLLLLYVFFLHLGLPYANWA